MFFEHETSSKYQGKARCHGTPVVIVVVLIFVVVVVVLLLLYIRLWWACLTKVFLNFIVFYSSWPPKKKEIAYPGLVKNNFSAGTVNPTIEKILTVNMGHGVRLIYPLLPYSDKVWSCRLGF